MRGRGWRAVFCFFSAILWRVPRFLGDRFSVPHGDSVRHPFGIRGRAEPAGACAPPTGGEGTILSHNLLNYVNFIPRKVAAKSFPPMPGICAIRCNRVPCQIVLGIWASGIWWDLGGSGGTGSCVKLVG